MRKIPAVNSRFILTLFITIIILADPYVSWAYLLDQTQEYRLKADKLQNEGKLDQAIVYYQKAIGLDKYNASCYNGLAICYEKQGLFSRAEEWYLRALEVNPNYPPAHYNLGLLYERLGNINKAVFHWKKRLKLGHPADPARIKARAKVARYAPEQLEEVDAQELEQSIVEQKEEQALDKILGRNKYRTKEELIQDYYLQGMQSYQEGDYRKTQEYFQKMIEALPVSN